MIVFIGGTGRCGSTMLVRVLRLHPELKVIPSETNLYPIGNHQIAAWRKQHIDPNDPRPHVEKTPANVLYANWILQQMADARYLHVHRQDRQAVINSMMRHGFYTVPGWGRPLNADDCGAYYDFIGIRARHTLEHWGRDRCTSLCYEALLTDTSHELARLCKWLGVSGPTLAMLEYDYKREKAAGYQPVGYNPWANDARV